MAKKDESKAEFQYKPLLIFYDCEAASSNLFSGDIIEIAARSAPSVIDSSFESLIKTEKKLCWFAVEKCGITEDKLLEKPLFPETITKFFNWIKKVIRKANRKSSCKYFPVLCAHGGLTFDFIMLLSNMKRNNIDQDIIRKINLHFADSFDFCKELQASNFKELSGTRLSMDSLFSKLCPKKSFTNRHRAMGDVNAMVDIFSIGPLKDAMDKINYITAETMCNMHGKQFSFKEQKLILEEKMSKLDAYTKTVNLKKLLQIHLTFEGIQRLFENCCSFTDFFEAMKDHGIDRKTAKYFACQFGGLGLKNQGTQPYCVFVKPEVDTEDCEFAGEKKADEKIVFEDEINKKENYQRPVNVPEVPPDEFCIEDPTECWEDETDPNRSFMLTVVKPAPALSITIDEFVSPGTAKRYQTINKQKTNNIEVVKQKNKRFSRKKKSASQEIKKTQITFSGGQTYELNTKITTTQHTTTQHTTHTDSYGDSTPSDGGVVFEEKGQQKQVTYFEDINAEAHSSSCINLNPCSNEQSRVASCQVECENNSTITDNIDDPTACRTDLFQNQSIKKIETTKCSPCVMFKDKELDEKIKNWPRVKIMVGDIPIYVPVDPSPITAEEETAAQDPVISCNVKEEQKAVNEDDNLVSLTCANEKYSVLHGSLAELSNESSDSEDSSARLTMVSLSDTLCDYQYPTCREPHRTNSNVCQPLCYFEPYTSGTSHMSPRYVNPYHPQPHSFYPMNVHRMPAQQMFHFNTNNSREFCPRPNNQRFASKMVQDFYSGRVCHYNQHK